MTFVLGEKVIIVFNTSFLLLDKDIYKLTVWFSLLDMDGLFDDLLTVDIHYFMMYTVIIHWGNLSVIKQLRLLSIRCYIHSK